MSADASTINHEAAAAIARGLGSTYTSPSDDAVRTVFAAYLGLVAAREQLMHQLDIAREDRGSALRAFAGLEEVNAALTKERDALQAAYPEYADPNAKAEREHLKQLLAAAEKERDAARAGEARLREVLEESVERMEAIANFLTPDGGTSPVLLRQQSADGRAALAATDSGAWLESRIAERTAALQKEFDDYRVSRASCCDANEQKVKALEAQLAAATNDAARAELRARELKEALENSCAPSSEQCNECVWDTPDELHLCPVHAALEEQDTPDSDTRLREVMERVALDGIEAGASESEAGGGSEAWKTIAKRIVDEVLGVKP